MQLQRSPHFEMKRANSNKKRGKKWLYLEAKNHVVLKGSLIKEKNETEIKSRTESRTEHATSKLQRDAGKAAFRGRVIAVSENQTGGRRARYAARSRSRKKGSTVTTRGIRTVEGGVPERTRFREQGIGSRSHTLGVRRAGKTDELRVGKVTES